MAASMTTDGSGKMMKKPYAITKFRESWTDLDKFLEALQLVVLILDGTLPFAQQAATRGSVLVSL